MHPRLSVPIVVGALLLASLCSAPPARADVYNLKVVTDASPDYSDMDSLVRSITGRWDTDEQKMWALYYWNHIARRQTSPMILHGKAETDPIRQFNDYGFTMCSTISGINCSIWDYMGYKVRYWDIAVHTVPEVFYGGRWHMYDNSLSNIYTLCDGKTIAGVEDIGKTLACDASGGKAEPGHIAKYHALNGASANGFLEGADTIRDLAHLGEHTFAPSALKFRSYYIDAERGHRYILNLRDGETYTRYYHRLDETGAKEPTSDPNYFVPSDKGKDPEAANYRYHIRGNGVRRFEPQLTTASLGSALHDSRNITALNPGLRPTTAGAPAEAVFKIGGANVITSLKINAELLKRSAADTAEIAVSNDNGISWSTIYKADVAGTSKPQLKLLEEANGAYEILVKVRLTSTSNPDDVQLKSIAFETITQLNSKTQPKLNLGKNVVYVGAGEQTESIVLWPELQGDEYKRTALEDRNIRTKDKHEGWNGVLSTWEAGEGYVIFKIDAPRDITRIVQSARMYVRKPKAEIRFEHSFDDGKTWVKSYSFTDTKEPWDDIHDQITTKIPAGTRSVQFKFVLKDASLYSVRMEANHKVANPAPGPLEVTFNWAERQADYSLVHRTHTQLVDKLPVTYPIDVGGADHPVVESLTVNAKAVHGTDAKYGYSDGKDVGGTKWIGNWVTYGRNLAEGKPYTVSVPPSQNSWGAGDADGKVLTDGRVGSSYSGGASYKEGALWNKGTDPQITVDLGQPQRIAAFRIHIHGYPFQDAIKGRVKDAVQVLVSDDGQSFTRAGDFDFHLRWKDVPVNYMWTDEETFAAHNHTLVLSAPLQARYVRFALKPSRMMVVSEVQVLDGGRSEPFDLKIALPNQH